MDIRTIMVRISPDGTMMVRAASCRSENIVMAQLPTFSPAMAQ